MWRNAGNGGDESRALGYCCTLLRGEWEPPIAFLYFIMLSRHQQLQRDKSGEGREMREGGEPKHEVASYLEGQPQGGRRKPEWHADLVPGPLDLEG